MLEGFRSYLADYGQRRREATRREAREILDHEQRVVFYIDGSTKTIQSGKPEYDGIILTKALRTQCQVETYWFNTNVFQWNLKDHLPGGTRDFESVIAHAYKSTRGLNPKAYVIYTTGLFLCKQLVTNPFQWFLIHPDNDISWKSNMPLVGNEMCVSEAVQSLGKRIAA